MSTMNAPSTEELAAHNDRRDVYMSYGFDLAQADALAGAKDGLWPLHHLKVKRALDAGLTHALAVEFYGPL